MTEQEEKRAQVQEADRRVISRRRFLLRALKAGGSVGLAGVLGALLYDPQGPPGRKEAAAVTLPDFSLKDTGKKLAVVSGSDRRATASLAIEALGGIGAFVRKGDRVVIKVNAAFASPPMLSATTHPDLLSEVIELCLKAGAAEVRVTDNPINDPRSCFTLSGLGRATEALGAELVLPREHTFRPTTLEGGSLIRDWPLLYAPLEDADKLIGLAPLKDHHRSGASMTMKNWYGLLGGRRNIFHQDIHNIIKELAMMVRPTLVLLDGTTTMMTNGPTGGSLSDLKPTNVMIASTDPVAADAFGCTLLGRNIADLPFIQKAAAAGAGTLDYPSLNPAYLNAKG